MSINPLTNAVNLSQDDFKDCIKRDIAVEVRLLTTFIGNKSLIGLGVNSQSVNTGGLAVSNGNEHVIVNSVR